MRSVVDANVLMQMLGVISNTLTCPRTGSPISQLESRAEALLDEFSDPGRLLLVPAPVLAEVLVKVEEGRHQDYLNVINCSSSMQIVPFDARCSLECARLFDAEEVKQLKRQGETKAKVAVDRQVIAIAVVSGAAELWTHDKKMFKKSMRVGLNAKSLADIEPKPLQATMVFT